MSTRVVAKQFQTPNLAKWAIQVTSFSQLHQCLHTMLRGANEVYIATAMTRDVPNV